MLILGRKRTQYLLLKRFHNVKQAKRHLQRTSFNLSGCNPFLLLFKKFTPYVKRSQSRKMITMTLLQFNGGIVHVYGLKSTDADSIANLKGNYFTMIETFTWQIIRLLSTYLV